jgi:hypothetical protein
LQQPHRKGQVQGRAQHKMLGPIVKERLGDDVWLVRIL